jgi:hypothetical protein
MVCKNEEQKSSSANSRKNPKKDINQWRREDGEPNGGFRSGSPVVPTKIVKVDGIRGAIIRVLNKITEDNFEAQSDDLLSVLQTANDPNAVKVVADAILEKVWYDKSFYKLYVSLCRKLWNDTKWNLHSSQVFQMDTDKGKKYFFTTFLTKKSTPATNKDLVGPFRNLEEACRAADEKVHLRSIFLALARDHFYQRERYILESQSLPDSTRRYKLRRKLFGTVEILGQFFKMGFLPENVVHFLFLSLLHSDHLHQAGAKYEEELEAFHLLWNLVKHKIRNNILREYQPLLESEVNRDWCSRISFMIQDMLEDITGDRPVMKLRKSSVSVSVTDDDNTSNPDSDIVEDKAKKVDTQNVKEKLKFEETLTNKVLTASRSCNETSKKQALQSLYSLTLNKTSLMMITSLSKLAVRIASTLIKDSTEYGEYAKAHLETLLDMLRHEGSGLTFTELSEAFSEAGEDIAEIKLDAPKAPVNMSFLLSHLLRETQNDDCEVLQISISKTSCDPDDTEEDYEILQKQEWKRILGMVEKEIDRSIVMERVNLFSMSS